MKLLSIAIPCYNSQDYMRHAIETLLAGGEDVEILVVNDGSKDKTADIAAEYQQKYPTIVRAINKENGGHGDAVMTGLKNATGLYFKVVDSDDWVDEECLKRVLAQLRAFTEQKEEIDMLICNYVYDKVGVKHKHVMQYRHAVPQNRVFDWNETRFKIGEYLLMHSVIYRTALLNKCGLNLPKHTFYVDELYVYQPLPMVKKMYYMDENLYHYFIGREDQSVQENVMIRRIDQALLVNRMLVTEVDLSKVTNKRKQAYMRRYLEIVTTVSSILLLKSGTAENKQKKDELWKFIREENPYVYKKLRHGLMGHVLHLPGKGGRRIALDCANGSSWNIAKAVFDALGATTLVINAEPNGLNINRDAGSTHIGGLQKFVVENHCDVGFAFDGDADRCLCVDETGMEITGDHILFICGRHMKQTGELLGNTVVATVMSNLGLFRALDDLGIASAKTAVGDKYVYEYMTKNNCRLGGEQSGHIIFSKYASTGDGILTSLKVMEVMCAAKKTLHQLASDLTIYPQKLINVRVKDKKAAQADAKVQEAIRAAEEKLGDTGRVLVRESGTEPLVRVMVEAQDAALCAQCCEEIAQTIRAQGWAL